MSLVDILFETLAEALGVPAEKSSGRHRPTAAGPAGREDAPAEHAPPPAGKTGGKGRRAGGRPAASVKSVPLVAERAETAERGSGREEARPAPAARPPSELADRIRRDPAAARAAFVYSEIFGPPLAERGERRW